MRVPTLLLGILCAGVALVPQQLLTFSRAVVHEISDGKSDDPLVWISVTEQLSTLGRMNAIVWTGVVIMTSLLARSLCCGGVARAKTWGCAYGAPAPRMQYTAASLSELMAVRLLPRCLRPRVARCETCDLFPTNSSFSSSCPDPVMRDVYEPFFARWSGRFATLRILQQGKMHVYLVYIMAIVMIGLSWVALRSWLSMS
jgi:hypothetical protein